MRIIIPSMRFLAATVDKQSFLCQSRVKAHTYRFLERSHAGLCILVLKVDAEVQRD